MARIAGVDIPNNKRVEIALTYIYGIGLKSAQDTAASAVKGASYHANAGEHPSAGGLAIDHIFYTPDTATPLVHCICKRSSDLAASDHCPVYTDFALQ